VYQEYCSFDSIGSLRPGHWHVFFVPAVGDILCCAHKKDDCLALCMGAAPVKSVRQGMQTFKAFLAEQFQVKLGKVVRSEGCTIRQLPPNLGQGRVLLSGEAAGLVYLNGEGISAAMDSGWRAGQAVAQALQGRGEALDLYRAASADILAHMDRCLKSMHFLVGQ
jgi:flavin-dependent dehydrogenase